ncbi:two-component system sensor histidine kinase NtrB [Desulfobacter curvatus]|uniref:two-component system sensor histidine kinase NtrB n=1 Tax=Desulfobacter curvatus TaxID=2290 RepID=UPI000364891B|nr:ATP-binding protein [Desulfobacter curvatus]
MKEINSDRFLSYTQEGNPDDQSKAEVSLEKNFKTLTDKLPIGIILTSVEGEIINVNPEGLHMLGYSSVEDLSGISIQSLYYNKKDREFFLKKMETGWVRDLEVRFQKSDGSEIWCSMSSVIQENSPRGRYFISSLLDITRRKEMEEEKSDLLIQLTQTDKLASIGQLAAGIAHEINNPVGYVTSNLNSLEEYLADIRKLIELDQTLIRRLDEITLPEVLAKMTEEVHEYVREIDLDFLQEDMDELIKDCIDGLDRIKKIVIDLKDFAHPGKKDLEPVDINACIETTLNVAANELKYKTTVHKDLKVVPLINGIPQQLNQVFLNILVNAAQAIEKKGDIRIKTWQKNNDVFLTISDTGCGIDPEHISKIFDPFFTTKEVGKGTGLGMNIAYNIIQQHGGSISVKSEKGKGTTFTVNLPVSEDTE